MPVAEEDKILPGEDSANDTTITDPDTQIAAQDAPGLTPPARNSKLLRILLPVDVAFFDACGNFTIAVGTDGSVLTSVAGHKLDWEVLVWRGDPQRVCRAVYPQMP